MNNNESNNKVVEKKNLDGTIKMRMIWQLRRKIMFA